MISSYTRMVLANERRRYICYICIVISHLLKPLSFYSRAWTVKPVAGDALLPCGASPSVCHKRVLVDDGRFQKFTDIVGCRYNAVQCIIIFYAAPQWLMQNIYQNLYSQWTPYISPSRASYEVYFVNTLEKMHRVITAPHSAWLNKKTPFWTNLGQRLRFLLHMQSFSWREALYLDFNFNQPCDLLSNWRITKHISYLAIKLRVSYGVDAVRTSGNQPRYIESPVFLECLDNTVCSLGTLYLWAM